MFDIREFLDTQGWSEKKQGFFSKALKTIKFVGHEKLMIALNYDDRVKHKHIVTCLIPDTLDEADTLFKLTMLSD